MHWQLRMYHVDDCYRDRRYRLYRVLKSSEEGRLAWPSDMMLMAGDGDSDVEVEA